MKKSILIVLAAVAGLAATASTQTSLDSQSEAKYFAAGAPSSVTLRTRPVSETETAFYLIASKASAAQVLQQIARVTGELLIAAPALQNSEIKTFYARGFSLEDLIEMTSSVYGIQSKTIAPGVRLFSLPPIAGAGQRLYKERLASQVRNEQLAADNRRAQLEKNEAGARANRDRGEKLRADPRYDPFVVPYGGLNPNYQPPQPQPDWEKREFNGREFYYVPLPRP